MKPVMNLKREIILRIRDLGRHLRDVYGEMPRLSEVSKDERTLQRMHEYFGDPVRIQLEKMIGDLIKDERAELAALVDLGELGKNLKDWDSLLEHAKQTDGQETARNLVGRSPFAYLIDQGLAKIQVKKYEGELALAPLPPSLEPKTKTVSLMLKVRRAIQVRRMKGEPRFTA